MLILAWICTILFSLGTLLSAYNNIRKGVTFPQFITTLSLQACIIWCLVYLLLLL